jgi:predicted metal-dependent hydrolase
VSRGEGQHRFRQETGSGPRSQPKAPPKGRPSRSDLCREPPPEGLLRAIQEFNRGEFFEQHETLEAIWIAQPDPIRYLYQGILQVGVGFYHWKRGNWKGAVAKLEQGLEKLEPYRPECQTIDVERLSLEARALLKQLRERGPGALPPFPPPGLPRVHRGGS